MKRYLAALVIVSAVAAYAGVCLAEEPAKDAAKTEAAQTEGLQNVTSTVIKEVGYDPATKVLTVVMVKDNETYEYKNVPESVYKGMLAAESKGAFFAKNIKGKYEFTKK